MRKEHQSILVIGSLGHKGATKCIQWGELVYVGDYDFLIVNVASLTKEVLQNVLQNDGGYFGKLRKDITDVQQNKGIAISCILGPYTFSREISSSEGDFDDLLRSIVNNYSWSPVIPILEHIPVGEKIDRENAKITKEYLDKIKNYSLLYDGCVNNTGYVDKSRDGRIYTKCHKHSLLKNNIGRDIAFAIVWRVHQYTDYNVVIDGHIPIEFLPPTESVREGIDILISDFCKAPEEVAPPWVDKIILPGNVEIQEKINEKIRDINAIDKEIKNMEEKLSKINFYKKLLYSHGNGLEEAVEKSLSLLGISIRRPEVSNVEDYFFETPDKKKIYFEIRGVNRLMQEGDLAQLIKRLAEKPSSTFYKTRGVFIFNHQRNVSPHERKDAFHHNIERQAQSFNICLLDTKTLFDLVKDKLEGKKIENLDKKLFNTIGIFRINKSRSNK